MSKTLRSAYNLSRAPRIRLAVSSMALVIAVVLFCILISPAGATVTSSTSGLPRYANYPAPAGLGDKAGEPSIGINWKTERTFSNSMFSIPNGGTAMYYGGFLSYALKVTFDDGPSPANATWEKKALPTASTPRVFGDPILFTDHDTGRTFISQLEGLTPAGSTTDITDDDGNTFMPSEGSGLPSNIDHQTFGGGPYHDPAPPGAGALGYQNAVYYCSQSVADAACSISLDGGRTFGPAIPMFTISDCDGLHGHIKVGADGTAYVPNKGCGGAAPLVLGNEQASIVVSEDNSLTWKIRPIPHPTAAGHENDNLTRGDDDPSVGVAADGTIYLGYQSLDGHPRIAVSHDKGVTWSQPYDVGAQVVNGGPVLNTTFPAVVAGDSNRAAFAFYGSETGGDNYNCGEGNDCSDSLGNNPKIFTGVWYLYVASTFDGGQTWTTENVTPADPVQRGGICGDGTCRNQLDFFDATIDKQGRVLIGWDDGCVGGCVTGGANSFTAKATITRQTGGKRMFAAFDPAEPALPGAPKGTGLINRTGTTVSLSWANPDNGGAPITAYKVYRKDGSSGSFNLIATVSDTNFSDTAFLAPATNNSYRLTAVNSQGEGPYYGAFSPVPDSNETECVTPGLTKLTDAAGDTSAALGIVATPAPPGSDLLSFQIAQPYAADGVPKLVFTINTDAGQSPQVPGSAWYVAMRIVSGTTTRYEGVHMAWNSTTPTFESYTPGANTSGGVDGRFVTTGSQKPAELESSYAAPFNKVVIVVKASDLGLNPGDTIDGFVSGVSQSTDPGATVGRGATALYDEMLDGLGFTGTYTLNDNAFCPAVNPTPTPTPTPTATPTPGSDGPQTFQGTYDPNPYPCATARHHFNVGAGKARIVVQVNATLPSNDLSVSLLYGSDPNPVLVQKTEDTGTCCEALVYQPAGGIPAGEYQVQICQTPTPQGVPQNPPYDYIGTFTADSTLAPVVTPTPTPIPTPMPVYQKGGIAFSPNVAVRASVAGRDGEPSLRVDKFGNAYVAGIRGVPAGVDLWYFDLNPGSPTYDPLMRNPIYRGQPDQFSPDESLEVGADGGGDVDLAVGFDEASPGNPPYLAFSSLTAANVSTARSTDRGQTFIKNPAGNVTGGIPADDRQWMEFFGKDSVYLLYRTLDPVIAFVQRSNDGGLTYGPAREVGSIGQVGGISVDQNDGTVYVSGANGVVAVGTPASPGAEPLTYTIHNVAGGGGAHIFFTVKAAKDGTVYACYSDDTNVFIRWSKDKGNTWSPAVRVSDGPETATSVLPWMETGPTPGSIGVVWYGTTASSNNDNADWKVFFAQSLNATDANPVFRQAELSDHFIHGSNISEGGLATVGAAPNRNLLDYFQIGFDPTGAAVVAYTDDHNDFDGNVYVARQISGPGVKSADIPAPVNGSALPQPTPRPANAPQVIDFAQDSKTGLLTVLPLNDPLDILSVKYSTEGTASNPVLVATMKVSDLSIVPPLSNWRMNFTANAPDSRLSPTGDYSFGLSDRGDQFFVRATTDALGTATYTFGTAVRQHQYRGFIAYTDVGAADSGSFDSAAGTITIKVSLSKLNATLAAGHPPIGPGSILAGLRGGTFTTGDDNAVDRNDRAKSDVTRGGIQYSINSAPTAALTANPTSGAPPLVVNFDGSGSSDPDAGDTLTYTFDFGDGTAPVTVPASNIAHTYNQLGKFTASLTVKDSSGFTSNTATVEINVTNRPPTAALSATPTSGYAPLVVNFDGSASSDPDTGDSIASYTFDFGDGAVVTQPGAKIAHTYNAGGIYTAKLTVADTHGGVSTNSAQVPITVNSQPTTDCTEDDDVRITYSDGWHLGTSTSASAGHFRWHQGKSPSHTAAVDFSVPANGTGVFSYRYGKSTKGGTADVYLDGVLRGTINFKGTAGSDKSPEFTSGGVPYEARYDGLAAGSHRFELRNMADSVFVDGFCLTVTVAPQVVTSSGGSSGGTTTQTSFTGTPTTGPGPSTSNDSSVNAGQESKSSVSLGTNARALSIVAETSGDLPVKLALVSPTGLTLQIVDAVNGVAVLTTPVTQGGIYTVKVINVNLGPVQVWTVATPTVAR